MNCAENHWPTDRIVTLSPQRRANMEQTKRSNPSENNPLETKAKSPIDRPGNSAYDATTEWLFICSIGFFLSEVRSSPLVLARAHHQCRDALFICLRFSWITSDFIRFVSNGRFCSCLATWPTILIQHSRKLRRKNEFTKKKNKFARQNKISKAMQATAREKA